MYHFFLACRAFPEKSADCLMGVPLYITCCFFLSAFNILSLSLCFAVLIIVCLGVVLFGLILLCFLDLDVCFLSQVRDVFSYCVFRCVLCHFLAFVSPSGTPLMQMLVCLMLFQRSFKLSSFVFILFFVCFSLQLQWFLLLCPLARWSIPLYHLIYCCFLVVYFLVSEFFISDSSLYFLSLC